MAQQRRRFDALDGLRAIAVLLVIFFHVSVPGMGAGYIGVDIFFVLSGYLITAGLIRSIRTTGKLDLLDFWARRFKRLLPAAALVILAVYTWASLIAPLYRSAPIGKDSWWTIFYLANWRFINSASYFESDGTTSPLTHMWSLAVEEQFYLAWPLIITAIIFLVSRKVARKYRTSAILLALILASSFIIALSVVAMGMHYTAGNINRAYMGTDSKAFEPMIGALLALLVTFKVPRVIIRYFARPLAWGGAVTMIALFTLLDGPPPAYYLSGSFAFSLATAALIAGIIYIPRTPESRALSWGPLVYIGRISYGLYLWHWPWAIWLLDPTAGFQPLLSLLVVLATFACAAASYHLVEMPIREGRISRILTPRKTLAASLTVMAALAITVSTLGGTPLSRWYHTMTSKDSAANPNVLMLVGDSVPARLAPAMEPVATERGLTLISAARGACTPMALPLELGTSNIDGSQCADVGALQDELITAHNPGTILWWSRYEVVDRYDGDTLLSPSTPEFWEATRRDFDAAVRRMTDTGAKVVVMLTERPGIGLLSRPEESLNYPILQNMIYADEYRQEFRQVVLDSADANPDLLVVDADPLFCPPGDGPGPGSLCDDTRDGSLIRPDGSHIDNETFGTQISTEVLDLVTNAIDEG